MVITAVIGSSASGKVAPPFFLVQGTHVMEQFFSPLDQNFYSRGNPALSGDLGQEGWFSKGGRVVCIPKGSMDMHVFHLFIHHKNEFVRQFAPTNVFYLPTLDVHGSRKGAEWVRFALDTKCEVAFAPANKSHFLQPCDQDIDKGFKLRIRVYEVTSCTKM